MGERTNDDQVTSEHQETTTTYQREVHERSDADGNVVSRQVRESVSRSGGGTGSEPSPSEGSVSEAASRTGSPATGDDQGADS
jgi:hypothetical protein